MGNTVVIQILYEHHTGIGEIHLQQDYNHSGRSTFDRRKYEGDDGNFINNGDTFHFTSHGFGNCNGVLLFRIAPTDDDGEEVWFGVGYCTDAVSFGLRRMEFRGALGFYETNTHLTEDHYQALVGVDEEEGPGGLLQRAFGTVSQGDILKIENGDYSIEAILNYHPHHLISVTIKKK